jgi:predicted nuclease of restriction endonuclease-like RecB superfamily
LEKFSKIFIIENAPKIEYYVDGIKRIYFPDFYISELNLIVEIKSSHLYKKYKDSVIRKGEACIEAGFSFILIIDKKYDEFIDRFLST